MSTPRRTPLAIFAFRRPDHLQRLLNSVSACPRLEECAPIIFCDGPRGPDDADAVEATRKVAREWAAAHDAKVIERPENKGLARSIVGEVTALCAEHGRVIVLEDDLEVSPDFLRYMLSALDRYGDYCDVLQVSGFMYPIDHFDSRETFFLPLATTWGWATWAHTWKRFSWEAPGLDSRLIDEKSQRRFNLDDSYDYLGLLRARLRGENDSWGVLWQWAVYASGCSVLHPRTTLVKNHGYDGSGTHCGNLTPEPAQPFAPFPAEIRWPEEPIDKAAFERIKDYLWSRQPRSLRQRLRRRFDKWLKKVVASPIE